MNETKNIANFVSRTHYEDFSPALVSQFKIFILDTLAAGFVGSVQPWAKTVSGIVRDLGGRDQASIINRPWKLDISRAALVNGTMISSFECEPLTGSHASATVFPAALAVCEHEHLDGRAFMTALILGTEVSARIARTAVGLETERGFHNPGTQGPLAAAVAVGKLYNLNETQLVNALGIAGSCSAGLLEFVWEGASTKRIHCGRASQLGLESALLAKTGFTGPSTVLEGRYGYYNAFSLRPNMDRLLDGVGDRWAVQPLSLKSFATHVTHQAVVQAIQNFKEDRTFDPKDIVRIVIQGDKHIMEERHAVRDPQSIMGAQYSLPFTSAVALTRDMCNPLAYDEGALWDPLVRDLAKRIELIPMERSAPMEIMIELKGQIIYRLAAPPCKGSPKNPFTWEDVSNKFRRYTDGLLREKRMQTLIAAVEGLDHSSDIAEFARLISSGEDGRWDHAA